MIHWFLTVLLAICVFFYAYLKKNYAYFKELKVPYLQPTLILGNMGPLIFRKKHRTQFILDIYNSYPDAKYLGIYDFLNPTFFIKDLELIKSITIKNFDNFTDHKSFADESVDQLLGKNLFNFKGERWRDTRYMISPVFTSSKLKTMFELMVECTKNYIDYLHARSAEEANNEIDTKDLFTRHANDVIATTMFGINLNSLKDPQNKFYVFGSKTANLSNSFRLKILLYRAFPQLMRLLNIKYSSDEVTAFFLNIIKTNVNIRDEKGIKRPDMLQAMMNARDKENSSFEMTIEDMTGLAFSFYFGGLETTATQMCIMAYEIAIRPDVQQRLHDEIDEILKETNGQPTCEDIYALPYLGAVFSESMRKHTQTMMLDRVCTKSFELPPALPGGEPIVIKPGTYIMIPVAGIHHDPKYYENPENFDPDRYYQKKGVVNDVLNMGFGIGPRNCMGTRFAIMEIKILFFYLLSDFCFESRGNNSKEFKYSSKHISIVPENGYRLKIVPRTNVK